MKLIKVRSKEQILISAISILLSLVVMGYVTQTIDALQWASSIVPGWHTLVNPDYTRLALILLTITTATFLLYKLFSILIYKLLFAVRGKL